MFVQLPLWGFVVLLIFAGIGAVTIAGIIYYNNKKEK